MEGVPKRVQGQLRGFGYVHRRILLLPPTGDRANRFFIPAVGFVQPQRDRVAVRFARSVQRDDKLYAQHAVFLRQTKTPLNQRCAVIQGHRQTVHPRVVIKHLNRRARRDFAFLQTGPVGLERPVCVTVGVPLILDIQRFLDALKCQTGLFRALRVLRLPRYRKGVLYPRALPLLAVGKLYIEARLCANCAKQRFLHLYSPFPVNFPLLL